MTNGEQTKSVARDAGVLVAGRYAVAVLAYAGTALIARTLSPTDWGGFTLVFSILGILGLICDLRARRRIMTEIEEAGDDCGATIGSYLMLRVVLASAAYVIGIAIVVKGDYPSGVVAGMAIAGSALLLAASWNAIYLMFQLRGWFTSYAVATVLGQLLQLVLTVALVATHRDTIAWLMWPAVSFDAVILVVLSVIAHRYIRVQPRFEPRRWAVWAKEAVPVTIGGALSTLYFRVDTVMLAKLDTLDAVGLYGIGYKFSDLVGYLAAAVAAPVLPLFVRAWPNHVAFFRATLRTSIVLLAVLAVGVTLLFGIFAEPAIVFLYGSRFAVSADSARLLVVGRGLNFFTILCVYVLIATDRNRLYPWATFAGLVLNVGLNLVLIPRYSIIGAGWATIVTEIVVLAVLMGAVHRLHVATIPVAALVRIAVAGVALTIAAFGLWAVLPWPFALAGAGIAFLATLHLLNVDGPGGLRALFRPMAAPATLTVEMTPGE